MVKLLMPLGLYTVLDKAALAAYCVAWARHVEAEQSLQRYGMVVMSPNGFPIQSPYVALANKAWDQMLRALAEFGMSPSARSRVTAAKNDGGHNKWDGILD